MQVLRTEGEDNGEWIIVDCGAAVAHIMQPAIRDYYHLEEIWGGKSVKHEDRRRPERSLRQGLPSPSRPRRRRRRTKAAAGRAPAKTVAPGRTPAKQAPARKAAPGGRSGETRRRAAPGRARQDGAVAPGRCEEGAGTQGGGQDRRGPQARRQAHARPRPAKASRRRARLRQPRQEGAGKKASARRG